MGAIKQWALSIVIFLLFQGMMEILIPKGSVKRFIQLVLGVAFLMVAVGPVLQLFRQDLAKTFLLQDYPDMTETAAAAREHEYGRTQRAILEKQYGTVLADQCSGVLDEEGRALEDIRVSCTEQGEIRSVAVIIRSPEEKQDGIRIDLGFIQAGADSEPETEWKQAVADRLAACWGLKSDIIEILEE